MASLLQNPWGKAVWNRSFLTGSVDLSESEGKLCDMFWCFAISTQNPASETKQFPWFALQQLTAYPLAPCDTLQLLFVVQKSAWFDHWCPDTWAPAKSKPIADGRGAKGNLQGVFSTSPSAMLKIETFWVSKLSCESLRVLDLSFITSEIKFFILQGVLSHSQPDWSNCYLVMDWASSWRERPLTRSSNCHPPHICHIIYIYIYIWMFPKIMVPPNHHFLWVFHF